MDGSAGHYDGGHWRWPEQAFTETFLFSMPLRYSSQDIVEEVRYITWELREEVWVGDENVGAISAQIAVKVMRVNECQEK